MSIDASRQDQHSLSVDLLCRPVRAAQGSDPPLFDPDIDAFQPVFGIDPAV
jgi:hypothetical protein